MSYLLPSIITITSIVIVIIAIKNIYNINYAINKIKKKTNLYFIRFNIFLSVIFILGYILFIFLIQHKDFYSTFLLCSVLFILSSVFIVIVSVVTKEMGVLLFKIDTIRKLDPLTKIFNRGEIEKLMAQEFDRCHRYKRNASLLMIDINDFKSINDNYGHQAGDKVILNLIDTIKSQARKYDSLGRFGGDEFILIMPETKTDQASKFVQRLNDAIENTIVEYNQQRIRYSVSVGISAVNFEHSNYENWLSLTDKDLYKSKLKNKTKFLM